MGKPPAQAKAKGIEKSSPQGNSKRGKSVQVDSALQDSLGEYLPSRVNAFDGIVVKGAKEHNLKNVSVKIPRNKITVLTGLSGSGKSSLAFDTIYAEGQRRYIESLSAYARQFLEQLKKPDVELITGLSPAIAIDQKSVSNSPRSTVGTVTEIYDYLRLLFAKIGIPECPIHHVSLTHSSPQQMADEIRKLKDGTKFYILAPMAVGKKGEFQAEFGKWAKKGFLKARVDGKMIDLTAPPKLAKTKAHDIELVVDQLIAKENMKARLAESINTALSMANGRMSIETTEGVRKSFSLHTSCPQCGLSFPELEPRLFSFNNPRGACQTCNGLGTSDLIEEEVFGDSEGGSRKLEKVTYHRKDGQAPKDEDDEESFEQELRECPDCKGARIKPEALSVKVNEKNIHELSIMSAQELDQFMGSLKFNNREALIAEKIIKQIRDRLAYMIRVGTSYLSLHRSSRTLSGGEAQRLRLATQVGSSLIGVLYVMDEPSIGLHPRDHRRLLEIIGELRDRGNTIILVEHDEDTIRYADHVIDIGPRAGKLGGVVMAEGTVKEIQQSAQSLTGKYLRGEEKIDVPKIRRPGNGLQIALSGATGNNLNNVDCNIPLGKLVAITGVSGSGKSTLIIDTFYKALAGKVYRLDTYPSPYKSISGYENVDKVIEISQRPIGRTPRSTPATYVGLLPLIRDLYAQLPEAKIRGYEPGRFSFNVKGGRCETCMGHGQTKVEMHFLSDVFVTCEACNGRRYNRETLNILYNGKSISDVLDMTVAEALDFFKNHKHIHRKLETLHRVGLDYIHLGQSSVTISGGEAQRVKLSKELSKRATGKTVYILDEPTTGLHFGDIKKLIELLHELTDQGNTVVVIEHHLDVIKNADWVIDMGPDGGKAGGTLVGAGTPEDIVKLKSSITGSFLNEVL